MARGEIQGKLESSRGTLDDAALLKIVHHLGAPAKTVVDLSSAELWAQVQRAMLSEKLLNGIGGISESLGKEAAGLVPALLKGLELADPPRKLAFLFRDLGASAEEALPALRKSLQREDLKRGFRRSIENAIEEIEEALQE